MPDPVDLTYTLVNGTTADATEVQQNFDDIVNWIEGRFDGASAGQLWVANASGHATAKTASGDLTLASSGAFSIGSNKITTAMLQANAVTSPKLNLTTVSANSSGVTLSTSYQDIATLSTPTAGTYLFLGNMIVDTLGANEVVYAKFDNDTDPRAEADLDDTRSTLNFWQIRTVNGSTDVKTQAKLTGAAAASTLSSASVTTGILGIRIG